MSKDRKNPSSWASVKREELTHLRGVCLDIDDTLSTQGKLTSDAFHALWKLKEAGYFVVPITGRPAGWCDHIARFWPVDAVVGENGAFTLFMKDGILKRLETLPVESGDSDEAAGKARRARLERLGAVIRSRFPHARWASDQAYREYDLAIDFCEDVPAWSSSDVSELVHMCEQEGAHAKVSSIHVNAWFGNYDKLTGFKKWLDLASDNKSKALSKFEEWIFIGDSPNDEPLFRGFSDSVGVANLLPFLSGAGMGGRSIHPPRWITSLKSGAGFVEMADKLVSCRKK